MLTAAAAGTLAPTIVEPEPEARGGLVREFTERYRKGGEARLQKRVTTANKYGTIPEFKFLGTRWCSAEMGMVNGIGRMRRVPVRGLVAQFSGLRATRPVLPTVAQTKYKVAGMQRTASGTVLAKNLIHELMWLS
ncbi:hypothetical protein BJ165DRAFT_1400446 [Panaeolus papilionaceus]|nr:hypothetical protein BJ165DRAFT_1400446 [Panaeolus papilionaceus]